MMSAQINANGKEARAVRDSAALPLTWGLIDDARLGAVLVSVDRRVNDPAITASELAAIVRLLLILQTGRSQEQLGAMRIEQVSRLSSGGAQWPGMQIAPDGSLLFIANTHPDRDPNTPFIVLPTLPLLDRAARNMSTRHYGDKLVRANQAADEHLDALIAKLPKSVKAENGDAALKRWLLNRMRSADGGDPALAAILNPSERDVRKTVSAYFACDGDRYWNRYATALKPIAPTLPAPPEGTSALRYGTRHCPQTVDVHSAIAPLRRTIALRKDSRDPERFGAVAMPRDLHVAMTLYTFALVSFGTGQRCQQRMADSADIDPESGFAWVVEKGNPNHGTDGARGVYHCRMVRQQIAAYETYCRNLAKRFDRSGDSEAAAAIRELLAAAGLRFFDYADGKIRQIEYADLRDLSPSFPWPFAVNAGRKWLRSSLSGKVPSDAIAAQFGHHHDGFSVWTSPSALRPDEVRRKLEPAINALLSDAGFRCSMSNPSPLPKIFAAAPERISPPKSARGRAGRLVATAMWHGALLNEDRLKAVIEQARALAPSRMTPDWFDLDRDSYAAQDRWFVDPRTRALLDERPDERRELSEDIDNVLSSFLGPSQTAEAFKRAAKRRWRFKLPPILFELASGKNADNHLLVRELFDPSIPRKPLPTRAAPVAISRTKRGTAAPFIDFLNRCWTDQGMLDDRKRRAHDRAAALPAESFYNRMSPFERSLAKAVIAGFQARRRHNDPIGDTINTIRNRVSCLWHHVVPKDRKHWENNTLADHTDEMLEQRLPPLAPWRGRAASELAIVLTDSGIRRYDDPIIAKLRNLNRNYTANLLRATEYCAALEKADPQAGDAMILSYRAGFRFSELDWIGHLDWAQYLDVDTIQLDHSRYARLKTFESRRRIPIGLLLPADELARVRRLAADPQACERLSALTNDDPRLLGPLETATQSQFNFHPLRHAFATNAYAAVLWPDGADAALERFFDPHLLGRRQSFRRHLCGAASLGATSLHAVAMMMGHTHPWRTLFSYVHHLEVMLAAWVRCVTSPASSSVACAEGEGPTADAGMMPSA